MSEYLKAEHEAAKKAALYELLEVLGFSSAASALYAAPGVLTIPRSKADTRDGREEIIAGVQDAFEDKQLGVIVISDSKPLDETLAPFLSGRSAVGYA